jgi:tetratricopeptide (TPR) repeat protein
VSRPLPWDVRVSDSPEAAAAGIVAATRLLGAGDRAGAERAYRQARARDFASAQSWANLAALGIALDEVDEARALAQRALALDRGNADAWVNLGVANWRRGQRRDGVQAMARALALSPAQESAAWNLALMFRAANRNQQARDALGIALAHHSGSARLHQAMAETCRLLGDTVNMRRHVLAALALLAPALAPQVAPPVLPAATSAETAAARGENVHACLFATADALECAGIPFHLVGGTLLALWRDGRPFRHDKDIDLGVPHACSRDAVEAAMAHGFRRLMPAGHAGIASSREWVLGYVHEATGVAADLFFMQPRGAVMHNEVGWPDHLASDVGLYALQTMHWAGRDWQVPSPPDVYLEGMYGPSWRTPIRHFDTQLSSPSTTAECLPRAINLGLLRLLVALRNRAWEQALALCVQLSAREKLAEVEAIQARLLASGIG